MKRILICLMFLIVFKLNAQEKFESGFINHGDVSIHFLAKKNLQAENQPALLFVPGCMMPAWIWKEQLNYFSKHYTVVAMDPRSQGESSQTSEGQYAEVRAKDIKAVIDQLHLKPVVLIGWSLAVCEVVSYLDQFGGDGIAGIVLVDGFAGLEPGSETFHLMTSYWSQFQKKRAEKTEEFVKGMFQQPQKEEFYRCLIDNALKTPTNTVMALIYNFILMDYRPTLPKIQVPTLVVSIHAPWLEAIKDIQKAIPKSRLEIIDNAGHALFIDQPQQFNHTLEKFLENDLKF